MPYSVKTLAKRWDCSPKHIYNLIAVGELKTFGIGKQRGTRISDKEVERWESTERSPTATATLALDGRGAGGLQAGAMASTLVNVSD